MNPLGNRLRRRRELRLHERITTTALRTRRHSPHRLRALSEEARAAERATSAWIAKNTGYWPRDKHGRPLA